jgi:hypothetical protein
MDHAAACASSPLSEAQSRSFIGWVASELTPQLVSIMALSHLRRRYVLAPVGPRAYEPATPDVAIRGGSPPHATPALSRSDTLRLPISDSQPPIADAFLPDRHMATHPPRPSKLPIGHRSSRYPGHEPSIPELVSFPCGHVDFGAGHRKLDRAIVSSHGTDWEASIPDPLGSEAPASQA